MASASVARTGPAACGTGGSPSTTTEYSRAATAAPRNCTAVTAIGSRSRSIRFWATVNVAETSSEAMTRPSPAVEAPPPRPPVTRPTPASDTTNPSQATGGATDRCQTAAITATSTGTAPMSSAAWVTLVSATPAFCRITDPPYPMAPETSTSGVPARRSPARAWAWVAFRVREAFRRVISSRTAAARPNRATVSQPAGSQASASLDNGTVVPHSIPAAASAAMERRRLLFMHTFCQPRTESWLTNVVSQLILSVMAVELDEVDVKLLTALQEDADSTNVELARLVGLSPAATLHRVRWLKESGVIRVISAQLDPAAAGFPLQLYVMATLSRHDARSERIFEDHVRAVPQIISADIVAGETDYLLSVVARDVAELQQVLAGLATRGGQRLVTYLRLSEVKPPSRLPLDLAAETPARQPRRRRPSAK
jgi:Lrp/AsnC family transcriptional regulator, leucine-responsive regulatory protein